MDRLGRIREQIAAVNGEVRASTKRFVANATEKVGEMEHTFNKLRVKTSKPQATDVATHNLKLVGGIERMGKAINETLQRNNEAVRSIVTKQGQV